MRRVVDLPQPDGPTKHDEFLVVDLEVGVIDSFDTARIDFAHVFEENFCHSESLSIPIRTETRWAVCSKARAVVSNQH